MRNVFLSLLSVVFISCSNPARDVDVSSPVSEVNVQEKVQQVAETFVTSIFDDFQKDEENKATIDTVKVLQIDTLTDKSILIMKINFALGQQVQTEKIRDLKTQEQELNTMLGVYDGAVMKEVLKKEIQEMITEINTEKAHVDSLNALLSNEPDSLTFRYYYVLTRVTATEPSLVEKSFDLPIVITDDFKVKQFEDL